MSKKTRVVKKVPETPDAEFIKTLNKIDASLKNKSNANIDTGNLMAISRHSKNIIENNEAILDIFPDLELAQEILVSTIIAPNDMLNTSLTFKLSNINIPTDLQLMILNTLKTHAEEKYNLLDKLPNIIEEVLFKKGAYCEVIIPDNFIKDLNKTFMAGLESAADLISKKNKLNIIESKTLIKDTESNTDLLMVTDSVELLNLDAAFEKAISLETLDSISNAAVGFEANDKLTSIFSKEKSDILTIENKPGDSLPINKTIAPELVIPIVSKDDPSKHYGYFILVDENGIPINSDGQGIDPRNMFKNVNNILTKRILTRAKKLIMDTTTKAPEIKNIDEIRDVLLKEKIEKIISNSKLGPVAKIDLKERKEILDIILDRLIKNQKTRILFVPKDLVVYYAYKYRKNGTGKSLLERLSVLASMRAIIVFVSLLSFIKSSIPITEVNAELDEQDVEYEKTMEKIMNEVMRSRQLNLPIGILKVDDLVDWVHRIGFSFKFQHPGLPNVNIDVEEKTFDVNPVNDELKEMLDKHIIMALGLTPEIIDNAYSPDFATTVIANNKLLNKRIMRYQRAFNIHITEHIKKLTMVDGVLKRKIYDILKGNVKKIKSYVKKKGYEEDYEYLEHLPDDVLLEFLYREIIQKLIVHLPKPETKEDQDLSDLFDKYTDNLDKILDQLFSSDALPSDLVGELGDKLENIKQVMKAILIKKWVTENGYMGDISKVLSLDEDGNPTIDVLEEYNAFIETIEKITLPFLKQMKKKQEKIDEKLDKIENGDEEESENNDEDTENNNENEKNNENTDKEENTSNEKENENSESEEESEENENTDENNDEDMNF